MVNFFKVFYSGVLDSTAILQHGYNIKNRERNNIKYESVNSRFEFLYLAVIIYKEIAKMRIKELDISFSEVVYAGHTENNLKEFDNFYTWSKEVLHESDKLDKINNIATSEHIGFYKRKDKKIIINILLSLIIYFVFVTKKIKLNPTSVSYVIDYTKAFITYYRNMSAHKGCLPTFLVVANDHNPKYVAISRVFKLLGVKRIYLQHAGVSNIFPKLDFEYSILINENSKNIYNRIGKSNSKILTVSRVQRPSLLADKIYDQDELVNICLLPTSIPCIAKLNKIILTLKDNPKVDKIFIKHHPRFNDESLVDKNAIPLKDTNNIGEGRIIFVSGNTTAALDFALKGEETYQNFEMDKIPDDYYGFVSKGISKQVSIEELSSVFWSSRYNIPIQNLIEYCPHLSGEHDSSLAEFVDIIKDNIQNSIRHNKTILQLKSSAFRQNNKDIMNIINDLSCENDKMTVINSMLYSGVISQDEHLLMRHLVGG